MLKKTGVEQESGDGHEESLESTEALNNLTQLNTRFTRSDDETPRV